MTLGLLTAMEMERERIAALMDSPQVENLGGYSWTHGRIGLHDAVLASGGIGKVNAALVLAALVEFFKPDCAISTGCAGGLAEGMAVGDVVAGAEYAYHDVDCGFGNVRGQVAGLPPRFKAGERLLLAARGIAGVRTGLMVSGDQFISAPERIADIKAAFPEALACEMESAALAHACHLKGLPFISFRVISDCPGAKSGNIAQYENFWASMAEKSFETTRAFLSSL